MRIIIYQEKAKCEALARISGPTSAVTAPISLLPEVMTRLNTSSSMEMGVGGGGNGSYSGVKGHLGGSCPPHFDRTFCWEAEVETTQKYECPWDFCDTCDDYQERHAYRYCDRAGKWRRPDYSQCITLMRNYSKCLSTTCHPCPNWFQDVVSDLTLYLCIISLLLLCLSMLIFCFFKSLHCMRITIHKHLIAAFMIRFAAYIPWITLHKAGFFFGCVMNVPPESVEWLCKLILFLIMLSTLTSVWWMFIEGLYLSSRLSTLAMRSEGNIYIYCLIGWGIPLAWTVLWGILMEVQRPKNCWLPYSRTYHRFFIVIPMIIALLTNFVILMTVVAILIKKLWAENMNEDRKLWKTIKATLLLVPLLGIPNLLLFYEPPNHDSFAFNFYMILVAVLQNSQGIMIAIVYCFTNTDVVRCLKVYFKRKMYWSFSSNSQNRFQSRWMSSLNTQTLTTSMRLQNTPTPPEGGHFKRPIHPSAPLSGRWKEDRDETPPLLQDKHNLPPGNTLASPEHDTSC